MEAEPIVRWLTIYKCIYWRILYLILICFVHASQYWTWQIYGLYFDIEILVPWYGTPLVITSGDIWRYAQWSVVHTHVHTHTWVEEILVWVCSWDLSAEVVCTECRDRGGRGGVESPLDPVVLFTDDGKDDRPLCTRGGIIGGAIPPPTCHVNIHNYYYNSNDFAFSICNLW